MTEQPSGRWPDVPGYTITRRIGGSEYASVYEATQEDVGAPVALKVLEVAAGEHARARFAQESQVMVRLRGTVGIVSVFSATAATDGRPVVVMAHLDGGSLADRIADGLPLSIDDAIGVGRAIGTALAAAHRAGIVHGDIKPENVLFNRHGEAALSDFRIAKLADELDTTDTVRSIVPLYAPPERFTSADVDPVRSDIYSLGAVVYAALTGRAPHGTPHEGGVAGLVNRICTKPPEPIARTGVGPEVRAALEQAMATDAADRFGDADEFVRALVPTVPFAPARPRPPARRSRRHRLVWIVGAVALALIAFGVVAWTQVPDEGTAAPSRCESGPPSPRQLTVLNVGGEWHLSLGDGSFKIPDETLVQLKGLGIEEAQDLRNAGPVPAGTLVRVQGEHRVWSIDKLQVRHLVQTACASDVTVLPPVKGVLRRLIHQGP